MSSSRKEKDKLKKKEREKAAKAHKAQLRNVLEERKAEIAKEVELEAAGGQKKRKRANSEDGSDEELDVTIEYVFKPPRELEDIIQRAQQQATQNGHALVEGAEDDEGTAEGGGDVEEAKPNGLMDGAGDFGEVFAKYYGQLLGTSDDEDAANEGGEAEGTKRAPEPADAFGSDSDDDKGKGPDALSKRRRKEESRLKVAELKQKTSRPEVVEVWDPTAPDPLTLVHLKGLRNSVGVPRHWSQKRAYLQGKRGIEKPPFQLPAYIEATGIGALRDAYHEKEDAKKTKQKGRERTRPKMNRLDINYEVLRDAFFRHQTKPRMSAWGELYYEGKEFEFPEGTYQPGALSEALRAALGMESAEAPPPWLINMQRYGPPPSYASLRIPGVSAPIPRGAEWGFGAGQWGEAPVDEFGRPLYGDVFGQGRGDWDDQVWDQGIDKSFKWGPVEEAQEEPEEEEEEDEDEDAGEEETPEGARSTATGVSSQLPIGLATPDELNLRKNVADTPVTQGGERRLYQVLEQKTSHVGSGTLMGSDHVYVIPSAAPTAGAALTGLASSKPLTAAEKKMKELIGGETVTEVDVSFTPEEIEGLDEKAIKALYEARVEEERARRAKEDFSDLVREKAQAQLKKLERDKNKKDSGKDKDKFKF